MDKKQIIFIVLAAIILIGGALWYVQKKQTIFEDQSPEAVLTDQMTQIGYKTVRVSDGQVAFTFEVPENWLIETRNMGEKPMSDQEVREFFKTNYDQNGTTGDYFDFQTSEVDAMPIEKLRVTFNYMRQDGNLGYPNASISATDHIWYLDWSAYQTDFYILSKDEALERIKSTKIREDKDLKNYDRFLADKLKTEWKEVYVDGRKTNVAQYQLEVLENGERVEKATKGRPGGREYYVDLGQKILLVYKQANMGPELDSQFDRMIQTLRFE